MSARAIDIAEAADVGVLVEALASRLGPGIEVVIRRREPETRRVVSQAGDPVRTSARRVVDLLGVPVRRSAHRCMVEALVVIARDWPKRPVMVAVWSEVARKCCHSSAWTAAERAMRHGVTLALAEHSEKARAVLGADADSSMTAVLMRLMEFVQDDLGQAMR